MHHADFYGPTIRATAASFPVSAEMRDDLMQEGFLKLEKVWQALPPDQDFYSGSWRKQIKRIVYNAMVDYLRSKSARYLSWENPPDFGNESVNASNLDDPDSQKLSARLSVDPEVFERIAFNRALGELQHFLSDLELRIVREMVAPSEDFVSFVRRSKAIRSIYARRRGSYVRGDRKGEEMSSLMQYLQIDRKQYRRAMRNINLHV